MAFGSNARMPSKLSGVAWLFFAALASYTLCTLDGGDVAPHLISAILFLLTAFYLISSLDGPLALNTPVVCLLVMPCCGTAQTLWFPQKIVYSGWNGVLFWFTAASITFLATQVFRDGDKTMAFRRLFVIFCSAVSVLDLLEQASHTDKYYWLIQSHYASVSGPFAYWNNFAQFVELCLPITLWLAVGGHKPAVPYLVLAGLQIAAVIASGSRAGSALIIAEVFAVVLLAYLRNRRRILLYATVATLVVTALFVYAAGADTLSLKLQQRDQLAVRREINKSSLAMIRERPFMGWGLGSYVPVYRMFARYDDGSYVNRAHNDWLEWTAEGGILFSGLMLIVFTWSIKPAIRSVWGLGVVAIALHALVDYPFARFGVCGWYFALIGMLAACDHKKRA